MLFFQGLVSPLFLPVSLFLFFLQFSLLLLN